MKKSITHLAFGGLLSVSLLALGCGETESVTHETEIKGEGGTTTVTDKKEIETTGEAPPVVPAEKPAPATP